MTIELETRDKQYALDVVNIILCDLKLEDDPWFKVRNWRLRLIIYFIFTAVFFLISLLLVIRYKNIILGICSAVFLFCAIHSYGYIYSSGRIIKELLHKGHSTYTFCKDSIEFDHHNNQKTSFQWEYFRYIKRYGTGLLFIPKKKGTAILSIPKQYEYEIKNFLLENGIALDIYD